MDEAVRLLEAFAKESDESRAGCDVRSAADCRRLACDLVPVATPDYDLRQDALGLILTNDIVIQNITDFLRCWNAIARFDQLRLVLFPDDIHAEFDTFIADENSRSSNQLLHFVLAFSAEGAIQRVFAVSA